ncbi:LLM class F420-dependent oxidoreductase [Gordonia McavH-238-E]|uniref:LLM class F420-dependent oxidoreductase n=1 Tax=Gordonia sp. McavH-238-E TaxID=2917736 RepID=UPI001EF4B41F|nr:LLM class F420-dependent oxidoreductase [Gordonia sp. McavH-238-E]MCG7633277.1 LLM class F420-dependent oxidoreductase [Gordonia sp. McavH-238-E]
MKFGIALFPLRPHQLIDVSERAELLGYDSVWVGEHTVTPVQNDSEFPYAGDGDNGHDAFHANLPFYDPYAVLGHIAARTDRLRLAVSVSIVPLNDPFHIARSAATVDQLSGGRFILGMGAGWLREEYEVLGKDFDTRGKRFDESLDVLDSLFDDDVTEYHGEQLRVPPVAMTPKPMTRPHPPYVFGGHSPAAMRRAATRGDGWLASELSPAEVARALDDLHRRRAAAGRETSPFEVSVHLTGDVSREAIDEYREAGVDRLVIRPWVRGSRAVDAIDEFARANQDLFAPALSGR